MRDVETPEDCQALVHAFYAAVRDDALLGPVFASRIDRWPEHLDTMSRFWTNIVFGIPLYHGSPPAAHRALPIGPEHFGRWLEMWRTTVTSLYAGPRADEIVARAGRMAVVLQRHVAGAA